MNYKQQNNDKQNNSQPDPKPSKPVFADPKPERVTADNGGKKSNDN